MNAKFVMKPCNKQRKQLFLWITEIYIITNRSQPPSWSATGKKKYFFKWEKKCVFIKVQMLIKVVQHILIFSQMKEPK